ncbi:Peptidase S1/S6, chymotrypsin/Hap [Metarhizium robertsii ARSEF 23]|uniref:Peptidase S1/S6, chymotrypsin/Hap n=1 Tax=Metarhizium robertsii (strain ARSEF 23 / ATCC MYA-3075) TaxID=655844 RepID=E9F6F1_METRA|nr:Peptidase S1/S6, chymotrypsin/Hap [Metarhizium robertsii ARSEF 23]EFY96789.1 Peptidase S1/S6, chymotrypsin/Hap [Metarhizium robertsii ARSEF 23]
MVRKITITLAVFSAMSVFAATIDKRIVGGEDAKENEFPFIVSIHDNTTKQLCGGSLLDDLTVLTAGHCIKRAAYVKAGTLDKNAHGVEANISLAKTAPGYAYIETKRIHDIAILKLSTRIKESNTIRHIPLPADGSDPPANSNATVAGWGLQTPYNFTSSKVPPGPDNLRKAVLTVRPREYCQKFEIKPLNPLIQNTYQNLVCAGGDGQNICARDSGGPLVQDGKIIGIVARTLRDTPDGHFCNKAPSLYTRVSNYIPFITENLGGQTIEELEESLFPAPTTGPSQAISCVVGRDPTHGDE